MESPYLSRPEYYRPIRDPAFENRIASVLHNARMALMLAKMRLAACNNEQPDNQWIIDNFADAYAFRHRLLEGYVERILESQCIDRLDLANFLRIWSELREGPSAWGADELQQWLDEHTCDGWLDWWMHERPCHRFRQRPKFHIHVSEVYEMTEGLYCVRFYIKKVDPPEWTYLLCDEDRLLLFEIQDWFGRLTNRSGFVFIQ